MTSLFLYFNMLITPYLLFALLGIVHATTTSSSASFIPQITYRHTRTTSISSTQGTVVTLRYNYLAESETVDPLDVVVAKSKSATPVAGDTGTDDWDKLPASVRFSYTSSVIYSVADDVISQHSSSIFHGSLALSTSSLLTTASTSTSTSISSSSVTSTALVSLDTTSTAPSDLHKTATPFSCAVAGSKLLFWKYPNTTNTTNTVFACVQDTGDIVDVADQLLRISLHLLVSHPLAPGQLTVVYSPILQHVNSVS